MTPQNRTTLSPRRLGEEAVRRYAQWRDACAVLAHAYDAWSQASTGESPRAFAAYQAALDHEEAMATMYRAVVGWIRADLPSGRPIAIDRGRSLADERPAADDQRLRVLIADRDGFARRMLQCVLRDLGEAAAITGARDGREALALARQYRPDVLVVEIAVPPAGGVDLIRKVVPILPRARIVTVSAVADRDHAVLAALRAGAIGHIDKDTAPDQIVRLVTLAARGEPIVPRRLMTRLLAGWTIPPAAARDHPAP